MMTKRPKESGRCQHPKDVPPVPSVRQVGPAFAIVALFTFLGVYTVVQGLGQPDWVTLGLGTLTTVLSAYLLIVDTRALLRLIRLNGPAS